LAERTNLKLKPIIAKEPFSLSGSNPELRDIAYIKDKLNFSNKGLLDEIENI